MKLLVTNTVFLLALLMLSCGGKEEKQKEGFSVTRQKTDTEQSVATPETSAKASERIDRTNKGVGPVSSVTLNPEIDQTMAAAGKVVYDQMCLACHRIGKKFIGPPPNGILSRRSPEWIMNMILNPDEMVVKDPLAKDLLIEFNGSPMANQSLTEEQARAVLEYFRTL
jgi:mono/diheme cytochrome c family protein